MQLSWKPGEVGLGSWDQINVLTCCSSVQELCGPSRKRASEDVGGCASTPPSHHSLFNRPTGHGYLSGAPAAEPAHKRAGPVFQEEAEPVLTGTARVIM